MGWLAAEGPKWIFLFMYMATNVGLFVGYFCKALNSIERYYLIKMVGLGLPFARASAAVLNFNCLLILLPVCRNLLSLVRGSCDCIHQHDKRLLDKNLSFHKLCAYMICVQTAIHYWAHTFNFEYFIDAHSDPGLLSALSNLPTTSNGSYLNPIRSPSTNPMLEVVQSLAGVSGLVATLVLIVIVSSATEVIRRSYFEVFWFIHHLFVLFFIAIMLHGMGGIVRMQVNTDAHDPRVCADKYEEWGSQECPIPQFAGTPAMTWKWVLGPVILYLLERCLRFYRSQQLVVITKVVKHPSKVIQLQMRKKNFSMQAGQYVFLHCPAISHVEWHPFTLTSAPQQEYFSVHIRVVGDWTAKLDKLCSEGDTLRQPGEMPCVAIDGPFGTATEGVYDYGVSVLIAAGIGVTPFASVLKDVWYRYMHATCEMKLTKLYFYWICPDTNAFEWFSDLLKEMEEHMVEAGKPNFLIYNIYLTRGWDANQALNICSHEEDVYDVITGLKQKTYYGRPNWEEEFTKLSSDNTGSCIGVFFCGPKPLSKVLSKKCKKHSNSSTSTILSFNKENF